MSVFNRSKYISNQKKAPMQNTSNEIKLKRQMKRSDNGVTNCHLKLIFPMYVISLLLCVATPNRSPSLRRGREEGKHEEDLRGVELQGQWQFT